MNSHLGSGASTLTLSVGCSQSSATRSRFYWSLHEEAVA